jgi:hypothetical protein
MVTRSADLTHEIVEVEMITNDNFPILDVDKRLKGSNARSYISQRILAIERGRMSCCPLSIHKGFQQILCIKI